MIFQSILDMIFNLIFSFIDWFSSSFNWAFAVPDNIYNFLVTAFSYLAFFVPFASLVPLIGYHAGILGLRFVMMILGLIKRIPLA